MLLTRTLGFSASHRVERPGRGGAAGSRARGREGEGAGHGHNYLLEATVEGEVDPESGMVMDLKHLGEILVREVGDRFDHRNLNLDTPYFRSRPPTAENLASVLFDLLDAALPAGLLSRVRVRPTEDLWVEVAR